jgi:hypothetical protein
MKKLFLSLSLFVFSTCAVISCKKSKETAVNCTEIKTKVFDAGKAYVANQSKANCDAYKAAIGTYINSTCATAEEKTTYQTNLDALKLLCP